MKSLPPSLLTGAQAGAVRLVQPALLCGECQPIIKSNTCVYDGLSESQWQSPSQDFLLEVLLDVIPFVATGAGTECNTSGSF